MNDVNIANLALTELGADRISALDDQSTNARHVSTIYYPLLRRCLRRGFWNFALAEVALSKTTDVPVLSDYSSVFQLPSDFIRLRKTSLGEGYSYKIKGRKIYCNSTSLSIEYVWFNTDPNTWDDSFIELFVKELQSALAYLITGSAAVKQAIDAEKRIAGSNALAVNSQEVTPDAPKCGSWISGR